MIVEVGENFNAGWVSLDLAPGGLVEDGGMELIGFGVWHGEVFLGGKIRLFSSQISGAKEDK